ncbi:MAG TPA: GNAT family N-acetyltransferase [Marmoricola sp.]|jgi:GNAT superfamily N-acetyltransferase|nr:GNAT family N-acetyltransferase [Marmoricola sp.]
MCALQVRPLDPFDDHQMRAWYDVYRASETHGRKYHGAFAHEEVRAAFRFQQQTVVQNPLSAWLDGRIVGVAGCSVPMRDNLRQAQVSVGVHPDRWRQGVGTALLHDLERIARDAGRTVLVGETSYPYDGPADGRGTPGVEFATAHGFTLGLGDVQRVLDLPVASSRLDALAASVAAKHEGYTFRQVTSPVPDDIALALGELRAGVDSEAPMGEIEREPELVDLDRIREDEAAMAEMGRVRYATVAFAPDGSPAGYTEYVVPEHDRPWIFQWGTLVWREHRGHGLGLATKVRNTAWVQREHPDRTVVRTWNADVNAPMIAVNEAMGFRPVDRLGEFQKRLG